MSASLCFWGDEVEVFHFPMQNDTIGAGIIARTHIEIESVCYVANLSKLFPSVGRRQTISVCQTKQTMMQILVGTVRPQGGVVGGGLSSLLKGKPHRLSLMGRRGLDKAR